MPEINPDNLNQIIEKLTEAEKKLTRLNEKRPYLSGIDLQNNIINIRQTEEEIEYLTKMKEKCWEGYPEDDGYEEAKPEYNFWDDRTH